MRTNLDTDPNVVTIAKQLGIDIFSLIGRLHKFWSWANQHASAPGLLHRTSAAWIDHFVSCQGFADALIAVGWLLVRRDFLVLPQWDRHNSPSAQARAGEAIRKKMQRAKEKPPDDLNFCPENVRTREEKSREENIINIHTPRARPESIEEALVYAKDKPGYEPNIVQHWYAQRDSQSWIKANNQPVTNWRSDLDAWILSQRHRPQMPQQISVNKSRTARITEAERDKAITGFDPVPIKKIEC